MARILDENELTLASGSELEELNLEVGPAAGVQVLRGVVF